MNNLTKILLIVFVLWGITYLASNLFHLGTPNNQLAIISLEGPITTGEDTGIFGGQGTTSDTFLNQFNEALADDNVKGIIIAINSPGGTVVASKEIADAVAGSNKPVVAWIREIGTSGAYWVASASDAIVADPLSITGSIGVISSYFTVPELLERYNITYERLVTGKYKDLGTPYKELTPEERALLEEKLQQIHTYFVESVATNRNLDVATVETLANGAFYLGQEAYQTRLVDHLGGKQLAINITQNLANITSSTPVTYSRDKSIFSQLAGLNTAQKINPFTIEAR